MTAEASVEMPLFVQLRGAIFCEDGYNLHTYKVAPLGLKRKMNAIFASLDENGKVYKITPVPGCTGTQAPQLIFSLRPWPNPAMAKAALGLACEQLQSALDDDPVAKKKLGGFWMYLVLKMLPLDQQTQLDGLSNLCGKGRVYGTLQKFGSLAALEIPDPAELINEAFDRQAA